MAIFSPLSAKNAKIRFGTSGIITAKRWNVSPKIDELDTSNFEGCIAGVTDVAGQAGVAGYADYIGGLFDCDGTIEFDWDSLNNWYTFIAATQIANYPNKLAPSGGISFYTNQVGSARWLFSTVFLTDSPMEAAVRGKLENTITFKGSGIFYAPGVT